MGRNLTEVAPFLLKFYPVSSDNEYENSGGLVRFSRIAFNEDNTQAVFQLTHTSASLGGAGEIVLLKKQDNNWAIIEISLIWVS